jgi:hypothetical protein
MKGETLFQDGKRGHIRIHSCRIIIGRLVAFTIDVIRKGKFR